MSSHDTHAASPADACFMVRALELARRGRFTTTPNPNVGCVLVLDGQIIGEGWHVRAGEAHAEINAIKDCVAKGHSPKGATAYVTLEPCSHHGKTGPCSEALIEAGVVRVVSAMEDPNPAVSGRGHARLVAEGIEVAVGLLEAEARALNCGFIRRMTTGLPWVVLKMAVSMDGRTALANGESNWITSAHSRGDVQVERALSCAIVTGRGTVEYDNPRLTVRYGDEALPWSVDPGSVWYGDHLLAEVNQDDLRQPLKVVLDSHAQVSAEAKVFDDPVSVTVAATQADIDPSLLNPFQKKGVEIWQCKSAANGRVDVSDVLKRLVECGCNRVMVEAGATLAGELLAQGLVNEWLVYQAPVVLGSSGRPLFDHEVTSMDARGVLSLLSCVRIGPDLKLRYEADTGFGE